MGLAVVPVPVGVTVMDGLKVTLLLSASLIWKFGNAIGVVFTYVIVQVSVSPGVTKPLLFKSVVSLTDLYELTTGIVRPHAAGRVTGTNNAFRIIRCALYFTTGAFAGVVPF